MEPKTQNHKKLREELAELRLQLEEAQDTIEAIRTGQVDALIVQREDGHQLYTLKSADIAYRVFIEKMSEGAVTVNKEGIILYCNSRFSSMVKQPGSAIMGMPFDNFVVSNDTYVYRNILQHSWNREGKAEVSLQVPDVPVPVQLSFAPLEMEEGTLLSILVTDLSHQKATQQQLAQQNAELEAINKELELSNHDLQQFASVASHDLQEPLRKIQIFSNFLRDKDNSNLSPDSRKYLEKIITSATRMKLLVLDVLNYSKLSASNNEFSFVNFNTLITEILEDFEFLMHEKKALVHVGDLPGIEANRGQMRQVFQNIISNALKFSVSDQPPVIHITSHPVAAKSFDSIESDTGDYCLISIKDNGIGFDEKYVNNIFNLFERLHSKHTFEGTGIGLAITRKIIEKHNGLITARSSEGNGAEFLIILPVHQQIID